MSVGRFAGFDGDFPEEFHDRDFRLALQQERYVVPLQGFCVGGQVQRGLDEGVQILRHLPATPRENYVWGLSMYVLDAHTVLAPEPFLKQPVDVFALGRLILVVQYLLEPVSTDDFNGTFLIFVDRLVQLHPIDHRLGPLLNGSAVWNMDEYRQRHNPILDQGVLNQEVQRMLGIIQQHQPPRHGLQDSCDSVHRHAIHLRAADHVVILMGPLPGRPQVHHLWGPRNQPIDADGLLLAAALHVLHKTRRGPRDPTL
mmetsp:Transcript_90130/g.156059  ORF Transcript_90130/g.156059 Transcript_90130/m.156059 type:complete len:256 (-) Transcript_90130:42-809(-)